MDSKLKYMENIKLKKSKKSENRKNLKIKMIIKTYLTKVK